MTDLFVSATAALLLVLAVSQPYDPQPLPVQADFLAACLEDRGADVRNPPVEFWNAADTDGPRITVRSPAEMGRVAAALSVAAKPYYLIAVVPNQDGRLSGGCFQRISQGLAREYNSLVERRDRNDAASSAIFVVSVENADPEHE